MRAALVFIAEREFKRVQLDVTASDLGARRFY